MVDRFSGWCEVRRAKVGTESAGSKGLLTAMRQKISSFGVQSEISSDGASEFTLDESTDFYERWGITFKTIIIVPPFLKRPCRIRSEVNETLAP